MGFILGDKNYDLGHNKGLHGLHLFPGSQVPHPCHTAAVTVARHVTGGERHRTPSHM